MHLRFSARVSGVRYEERWQWISENVANKVSNEIYLDFCEPASKEIQINPWELKDKTMKKNFQLIVAIMLCGFGCGLLLAGFCCPPLAEIHHSVLIAFGEILTFSGSLIGIDYKYRYKE